MVRLNINALLISEQKNFSWLTSGRAFVNSATERSVASILIRPDACILLASNIEAERLKVEELTSVIEQFDQVYVYEWFEPEQYERLMLELAGGAPPETDAAIEPELASLRTILTEQEIAQVRQLGQDAAEAIERTAFELKPGESEFEISARLAANCIQKGLEPIVNLVAVDERIYTRRHPLPTSCVLSKYAMLVVCARRQGQIVSATRLVHFGEPTAELLNRHTSVLNIDGALIANTISGISYAELFRIMQQAYQSVGFPEEWKKHHQGGLAGYLSREKLLMPRHAEAVVQTNQLYAWNPSIDGVKSEDTIIVCDTVPEIVTQTRNYPLVSVQNRGLTIQRPDILRRTIYY